MSLLTVHRNLLERRRGSMDLVGPGPLEPHYEDAQKSLAGLNPTGRWVDLGSGAGFPGVVLASMYPDLELDLVESRAKRATFLEAVLLAAPPRKARLRVLSARVETLPDASYDGVTARAFAPPSVYLEHAARLLVPGGRAVVFLGLEAWAPGAGWRLERETAYTIDGKPRRSLVLIRAA